MSVRRAPSNHRNPLWQHFTKLETDQLTSCNYCYSKYSNKSNIHNLKVHLLRKHPEHHKAYVKAYQDRFCPSVQKHLISRNQTPTDQISYEYQYEISASTELQENEEITLEDITDNNTTETRNVTCTAAEQRFIDAMFLKMIVRTYQPATIVEEQEFIEFVSALNESYVLPKCEHLLEILIPEIYNKCLDAQKTILKQEATTVCLTIDRWKSINMDNMISITAHFINPDYQFRSVLLKCCPVNGSTSEDLAIILKQTCKEWEIFSKINWCVTDDAADIVQTVNMLGWNHYGCVAYKLNFILQNCLVLCDKTLTKVKKVVSNFLSSSKVQETLRDYQMAHGSAQPLMLKDSEPIIWNSIYLMIERFVALQDAIKAAMAEHDNDLPLIPSMDWTELKQLCKLLKPFNEATKELGADKYACASKVIAVVNGLKDVLQEINKRPDYYSLVRLEVQYIEIQLYERFHGIESKVDLAMCTILDPRYKMSMFLNENSAEMAKLTLVSEVRKAIKDDTGQCDSSKMECEPIHDKDEGEFSLWRRRNLILEKKKVNLNMNHQRVAQQEVESYMQEELAEVDPCEWWRDNQLKYPNLAKLFRDKCNMVATSIPSEQLFSIYGNTLWERRNRLSEQAEKIVFLNANLKDNDYINFMP